MRKGKAIAIVLPIALAAIFMIANPLFSLFSVGWMIGEAAKVFHPSKEVQAKADLLDLAAENGSVSELRKLADDFWVRRAAKFPQRTAHLAARTDQAVVLEVLVTEYDLDVNTTSGHPDKLTPLDVAVYHSSANAAKLLISKGAKLPISSRQQESQLLGHISDERTPTASRRQAALEVAAILIAHGEPILVLPDGPDPLLLAIRANFPEMVQLLVANGADTKTSRGRSGTPTQYAQQYRCDECLRVMGVSTPL